MAAETDAVTASRRRGGAKASPMDRARREREVITVHIKQRTMAWLLGLVLTVSGLACTSTQKVDTSGSEPGSEPAAQEACFNVRNVESFSPLHGRFVYVRLVGERHFLLTLDNVYTSLPFARGIAISQEFSRVCSDTGATLTFTDAGRSVSCRIVRVEAVDSKKAAQELVEDRTTPKAR
jgi:hypothetical protein